MTHNSRQETLQEWDNKWKRDIRMSDYMATGLLVDFAISETDDQSAVTNSITYYDFQGRVVATETPAFGDGWCVSSNYYDGATSHILRTTRTEEPDTLYIYDAKGELTTTVIDANGDGLASYSGSDRINRNSTTYKLDSSDVLWRVNTHSTWLEDLQSHSLTTATTMVRLTGLGTSVPENSDLPPEAILTGQIQRIDWKGNVTLESTWLHAPSAKTWVITENPASIQPAIRQELAGYHLMDMSHSAVTNSYTYDCLARQAKVTDGRGNAVHSFYDAMSQITCTGDAATNRTNYAYDARGRRISVTDPLNHTIHTAYDAAGNVVSRWGAAYPVHYSHDANGRMTSMSTTRDGLQWDTTTWHYDAATGLLKKKLYADGEAVTYSYTPGGRLSARTSARDITTSYSYDNLGQLVGIQYSDATPDVTVEYDRSGRQVSAIVEGISTNLFIYEGLDLICEMQNDTAIARYTDSSGRSAGFAFGTDYEIEYGYDAYGRFASVRAIVSSCTNTFSYNYLPGTDLLTGYTSGDFTRTLNYEDTRNLVTSVDNRFGETVVSRFDYENNAGGLRTRRIDSGSVTNSFYYNARQELTGAVMGSDNYGYGYDEIGNRERSSRNLTTRDYTANSLNQYDGIQEPGKPLREPQYDADGNMVFDGVAWHYTWNGENRLTCASNATHIVRYAYDHRGRMIWKSIASPTSEPTRTISYLWDGYNIIAEQVTTDSTTSITYNVWGLDLSGTIEGAGGVGGLLAVIQGGAGSPSRPFWPCYDANGNITEYVGSDGTVAAHYEYSPFGEITAQSGSLISTFTHRFSTKPWCPVTGLSEYLFRKYSPGLGRWISRDPVGEIGGIHLYLYCLGNPIGHVDVLGLKAKRIKVVFDFTSPDEYDWIRRRLYEPSNKIWVTNAVDISNWLSKLDECECLESVVISAHGAGSGSIPLGNIVFISGRLWLLDADKDAFSSNTKRMYEEITRAINVLSDIKEKLCKDATITFVICDAGEGESGDELHVWLKNFFPKGTEVILFPGECGFVFGIPTSPLWGAPKKKRLRDP